MPAMQPIEAKVNLDLTDLREALYQLAALAQRIAAQIEATADELGSHPRD